MSCQRPLPPDDVLAVVESAIRLGREAGVELDARRQAAERLVSDVGRAGRPAFTQAREWLVYRLHRRAEDYDASYGLTVVIAALQRVDWTAATRQEVA